MGSYDHACVCERVRGVMVEDVCHNGPEIEQHSIKCPKYQYQTLCMRFLHVIDMETLTGRFMFLLFSWSPSWFIWKSSVTVRREDSSLWPWLHITPRVKSQIRSRTLTTSSLAVVCQKQTHLLLWQYNGRRSGIRREGGRGEGALFSSLPPFFLSLSLFCWPGSKLMALVWAGESRAGQHTGLHNLITCFICCNLFLNQCGWRRKPSSRAVIYTSLSRCPASVAASVHAILYLDASEVCLDPSDICGSLHLPLAWETTGVQISLSSVHLILSV